MINNPFKLGDIVEIAAHGSAGRCYLVVDLDPPNTFTPYPSVMLACRYGGKVHEGVMEARFLRRAMA